MSIPRSCIDTVTLLWVMIFPIFKRWEQSRELTGSERTPLLPVLHNRMRPHALFLSFRLVVLLKPKDPQVMRPFFKIGVTSKISDNTIM